MAAGRAAADALVSSGSAMCGPPNLGLGLGLYGGSGAVSIHGGLGPQVSIAGRWQYEDAHSWCIVCGVLFSRGVLRRF
jgi:hypothetical protein